MNDQKHRVDWAQTPSPLNQAPAPPARPRRCPIAVIGAAAGGLDAIRGFFSAMPRDSGVVFVIALHLGRGERDGAAEALGRYTAMPVAEIANGDAIEPNRVYLTPPGFNTAIDDDAFRLTPLPEAIRRQPVIDTLLRALAERCAEHAVGIILSGAGDSGTLGLQAIRALGGLTLAQAPESAAHPGMPQSAIDAGLADLRLPPEAMPKALLGYLDKIRRFRSEETERLGSADLLTRILSLLRARTKYDFTDYRKATLMRRLQRRMGLCRLERIEGYLDYLRHHEDEVWQLCQDLLIGVSGFFRDAEAFRALEKEVIGRLVERADRDNPVRVWVPACSSGEEAYSIAMLLMEGFQRAQRPCDLQIFATDIDEQALAKAREGIYPASVAADLGPERLRRFFSSAQGLYRVSQELRDSVVFASQNLISDPPFSRMDLISCRNLLSYLEPPVQHRIIGLFEFGLKMHGYLLLGSSETLGPQQLSFETVSKKWRLYRKVQSARVGPADFRLSSTLASRPVPPPASSAGLHGLAELAQAQLLADFVPAAVLVDRRYQIRYFFGATQDFLEMPTGAPSLNLLQLARQGIRSRLPVLLQKALQSPFGPPMQVLVRLRDDDPEASVELRARLLSAPGLTDDPLVLVTFSQREAADWGREGPGDADIEALPALEGELKILREDFQGAIGELECSNEELKTSNEEMMSMNEELQSANEEMETSKEELQALNEELNSVNAELQEKVSEVQRANDDINNLLVSTDVATVFLDAEMRVKRFTPSAGALFNLRPADLERPLTEIASNVDEDRLADDAREVLADLAPRDREVQDHQGRCYLRRIRPYRTQDNRIEGVVLTFFDITLRIEAESVLRESENRLQVVNRELETRVKERTAELATSEAWFRTLAENVPDMFGYVDRDQIYRYVNRQYEIILARPREEILGHSVQEVIPRENYRGILPRIEKVLAGEPQRFLGDFSFPTGARETDIVYVPDRDPDGRVPGFFVLIHEISELKALERALDATKQRLEAIFQATADGILTATPGGLVEDCNPAAAELFGIPVGPGRHRPIRELLIHNGADDAAWLKQAWQDAAPGNEFFGLQGRRSNGARFPLEMSISWIEDLHLYLLLLRDVSERRRLEQEIIDQSTQEQERFGHEVHDGIGQQLTAVTLMATALTKRLRARGVPEAEDVASLVSHLEDALEEVRVLSNGLSPVEITAEGLPGALRALTERVRDATGIDCRFERAGGIMLHDPSQAAHVYRIAQEAVNNAVKHAEAARILVRLQGRPKELTLSVGDNGCGLPPTGERRDGLGLRIMRYRGNILGAKFSVGPGEDGGTLVQCSIPMRRGSALVYKG